MVTTVDGFHSEYLVRAMERGVDVMTEKPMVIDETQCQAVLDAEKKTGRKHRRHASTTATRRSTRRSKNS